MASTNTGTKKTIQVPIPIITLGSNYILQHKLTDSITTFINTNYSSTNYGFPQVTQDGNAWANDNLKVGISYVDDNKDYSLFLNQRPMVFLEVLNQNKKSNGKGRLKRPQWTHPPNYKGALNRTSTNYGGGDASSLKTEWDFTSLKPFIETEIEINPQGFYKQNPTLPQRWVDFVFNSANNLKWQRSNALTPTGNGNFAVNTFKQAIRFRFGHLDKDGRSIILGEPSEVLIFSPKWGYFQNEDDTYIYDWKLSFQR